MYSRCPICKKKIFKKYFRNHWIICYHNYSLLYYQYIKNLQVNNQQNPQRQQNYRQNYRQNPQRQQNYNSNYLNKIHTYWNKINTQRTQNQGEKRDTAPPPTHTDNIAPRQPQPREQHATEPRAPPTAGV